eukprot:6972882-Prymnesium_polylepis.1
MGALTSRHTVPSLVRPVRPARCLACACETHTMCGDDSPETGAQWISHARHASTTCETRLIVMLDSATAEAITTRAGAPSSPAAPVRGAAGTQ